MCRGGQGKKIRSTDMRQVLKRYGIFCFTPNLILQYFNIPTKTYTKSDNIYDTKNSSTKMINSRSEDNIVYCPFG